jgi:hypothetical protein
MGLWDLKRIVYSNEQNSDKKHKVKQKYNNNKWFKSK